MNVNEMLTKLAVYSYLVGLMIYLILIFTPFALALIWPVGMLPLLLPLAGCWGVIPYPAITYLGLSCTTGFKGTIALIPYYIVLTVSIIAQTLILIKALTAMKANNRDSIFRVLQFHHMFAGIFVGVFFAGYPLMRDIRMGINIFNFEHIILILIGAYGFILNLIVSLAIGQNRKL